jgi:hypothetical protein
VSNEWIEGSCRAFDSLLSLNEVENSSGNTFYDFTSIHSRQKKLHLASANGTTSRTQASDTPFEIPNSMNLIELSRRRFGRSPRRVRMLEATMVECQQNERIQRSYDR